MNRHSLPARRLVRRISSVRRRFSQLSRQNIPNQRLRNTTLTNSISHGNQPNHYPPGSDNNQDNNQTPFGNETSELTLAQNTAVAVAQNIERNGIGEDDDDVEFIGEIQNGSPVVKKIHDEWVQVFAEPITRRIPITQAILDSLLDVINIENVKRNPNNIKTRPHNLFHFEKLHKKIKETDFNADDDGKIWYSVTKSFDKHIRAL